MTERSQPLPRGVRALAGIAAVLLLLPLLGLDDNKLTFYHAGRFKQLSQFGGRPIEELIG